MTVPEKLADEVFEQREFWKGLSELEVLRTRSPVGLMDRFYLNAIHRRFAKEAHDLRKIILSFGDESERARFVRRIEYRFQRHGLVPPHIQGVIETYRGRSKPSRSSGKTDSSRIKWLSSEEKLEKLITALAQRELISDQVDLDSAKSHFCDRNGSLFSPIVGPAGNPEPIRWKDVQNAFVYLWKELARRDFISNWHYWRKGSEHFQNAKGDPFDPETLRKVANRIGRDFFPRLSPVIDEIIDSL